VAATYAADPFTNFFARVQKYFQAKSERKEENTKRYEMRKKSF